MDCLPGSSSLSTSATLCDPSKYLKRHLSSVFSKKLDLKVNGNSWPQCIKSLSLETTHQYGQKFFLNSTCRISNGDYLANSNSKYQTSKFKKLEDKRISYSEIDKQSLDWGEAVLENTGNSNNINKTEYSEMESTGRLFQVQGKSIVSQNRVDSGWSSKREEQDRKPEIGPRFDRRGAEKKKGMTASVPNVSLRPRAVPLKSNVSPTRALAAVRLLRVEEGGAFVDLLAGEGDKGWKDEMLYLERTLGFKTTTLEARDFRQVMDLVGGTVRWKRYLDYIIFNFFTGEQRSLERMEPLLLQIIRLGLYEILKLDRAPHAAINETVELAKVALRPGAANLVNALLRRVSDAKVNDKLPLPGMDGDDRSKARSLATVHSHPVWLVRRWLQRFGKDETIQLLQWNNQRPTFSLRANSLKDMTRELLSRNLDELEVAHEPSPLLEHFVRLQSGMQDVLRSGLLKDGLCTVQDESAGLVVRLLDPQPGESILDCCAAPGGKTLFAAAQMKGEGSILAVDLNPGRVRMVREAALRMGLEAMVQTLAVDLRHLAKTVDLKVDRVLLDAPCSGLGVLCKRADLRWRRSPESLAELCDLQNELMESAASLVRPGGLLVYSTCSIEAQENEERVEAFLHRHPEYQMESAKGFVPDEMVTPEGYFASLPQRDHIDGAFGARLRRQE